MRCHYFDAGLCRSCSLLETPYADQLAGKQHDAQTLLEPWGSLSWLPPVASADQAFRNKAKLVIGGTSQQPTLGILDRQGQGIDLTDCQLYLPAISRAIPVLADLIRRADLTPYSVQKRKGELKNILVTASNSGELMVRFVLRSKKLIVALKRELPWLHEQLPQLAVVSVNLLREHVALVEGDEEIILTERTTLPMQVNDMTLHLRPQSFFQTNTPIAAALYRQAQAWISEAAPGSLWDLYCGVGGFALHAAAVMPPRATVTGIEISSEAIASAQRTVAERGLTGLQFIAQDAPDYATSSGQVPEMLIVNPPRRGLGLQLSRWIENSGIDQVIYSSCNLRSLVKDLKSMPSMEPMQGKVMDMFPHSSHYETIMLLKRRR
ncbi:23S rRNA (uracil(747)-C(5))-methyltransferase RlmC [Rothia nasimurium]|uniref:23S rRNA (Uracil(747)-C(5))-methyltransferase RlmC n=1 Tax=Rothia nasimurium TaxID=85336 RepID=A0A4Y9F195_9MICC|nr:23S rRNA (uracil(747)-C(5))-methyltransferase RlmC [Rothia nasimurium]MBF0808945.1 23S rRNA (uracil(747)-C(5))-methyltransferase RlmC [Rothia nasimurium]TFU21003.1 23S rRNA (uracil(747)-C(5))-methyltransferase RlmC [Rothia nasimurium]